MAASRFLGLYIGDASAVIAQVDSKGEWVERFGSIKLAPGVVERGEVRNKEALVLALKELKKQTQPNRINGNERVVLGIAEQRVFLREFVVPKGIGKIDERIAESIRAILPTLPEEMVTDSMILGEDENGDIKALMVAVPKRVVDDLIKAIELVGLTVERVETKMMAVAREIKREQVKGKDQMIIYQSETGLIMSYTTNGKVRFSSVIRLDEIQRQGGIVKVIANAVGYINSRYPGREIQELLIVNGTEESKQLISTLAVLKLPLIKAQSRLVGTFVGGISVMQPAIGLSMSGVDEKEDLIDLTPSEYRTKAQILQIKTMTVTSVVLMIVASIVFLIALLIFFQSLRTEEALLKTALAQYAGSGDAVLRENLNTEIKDFNSLVEELAAGVNITGGGATVLRQLNEVVVPGIEVRGVLYERGAGAKPLNEAVGNYIVTGVADARETVLVFQDRLLSKPAFDDGQLYFGSLEKETEVLFRIVGGNGQRR